MNKEYRISKEERDLPKNTGFAGERIFSPHKEHKDDKGHTRFCKLGGDAARLQPVIRGIWLKITKVRKRTGSFNTPGLKDGKIREHTKQRS